MNPPSKDLKVALWAGSILAAAIFGFAGGAKLAGAMIGRFEGWGYTPSFAVSIGVIELVGAIALVIPRTSGWAALGLIVVMFGALGTHVVEGDYVSASLPLVMLGLLGFILFGRGLGPRGRSLADLRSAPYGF